MIEHLSYSSISAYLACGEAWRFRYVEQIKTPTGPELVFGTAFHKAIEGQLRGEGQALNLWPKAWGEALEGNSVYWGDDMPEEYNNQGVRMLASPDIQNTIGQIKPAKGPDGPRIEQRVELRVPGVPIPVIGYIDVITEDGIPGDFKTSARSWGADKAQSETQPLFYLAALNQAGHEVPGWAFRHYVFVKTKTPQVQVIEHRHKPSEVFWLFEVIQRVWRGIDAEIFPLTPNGWKCSPQYCDYWSRCRGK